MRGYNSERIRILEAELIRLDELIERDDVSFDRKKWILLARKQSEIDIKKIIEEVRPF